MSELALARALGPVQARGVGQGVRILAQQEEEREREQELSRALAGQKRARKAQEQSSKGGLFGGLLGGLAGSVLLKLAVGALGGSTGGLGLLALKGLQKGAPLIRALAAGFGSKKGREFATGAEGGVFGTTAGDVGLGRRAAAKEKLAPIDVGSFRKARGRERETEFGAGERAFGEDLSSLISGGATQDFMSALAFQSLLPGLFGGGGPASVPISQGGGSAARNFTSMGEIDQRGLDAMFRSIVQSLG